MRIIISIEDPDEPTLAWLRSLPNLARPPLIEPPPEARASRRAPDPDPDRPTDGRTLLGWADRHDRREAVLKLGRARGYPSKVVTWTAEMVADVYQVLSSKPPKGSQTWGGAADSGRVRPK